jgi:hypothetical protein
MGLWERGVWGGLVLFGRTTINGALDAGGNAASPKYEVYEGMPDDFDIGGGEKPFRFGGTDDNDNSGIIPYTCPSATAAPSSQPTRKSMACPWEQWTWYCS